MYPVLNRLEAEGLLTSAWREGVGGPGRTFFTATHEGATHLVLVSWSGSPADPHWTTPDRSAARYRLEPDGLRLRWWRPPGEQSGEVCVAELFGGAVGKHRSLGRMGSKAHHDSRLSTDVVDVPVDLFELPETDVRDEASYPTSALVRIIRGYRCSS